MTETTTNTETATTFAALGSATSQPAALAGQRVAICCHEEGLCVAITTMLQKCGCTVTGCDHEETRVADLRAATPDLVVIEAGGRDSGAYDLCQTLAHEACFAGAKTLMLLDSGRAIARRRARALGAHAVLALPVGMDAVQAEVSRLLGGA